MASPTTNRRKLLVALAGISITIILLRNFHLLYHLTNTIQSQTQGYFNHDVDRQMRRRRNQKLNVLILYPDDWRHSSLNSERPVLRTPFLNKLAEKGIRFTHNCVTTSICWISRATLFMGQYSSDHESIRLSCPHFVMPERWNSSWVSMLQKFDYYVGHVGKWQYYNPNTEKLFNWSRFHEGQHWYDRWGEKITAAKLARDDAVAFLKERPKDKKFALTVAFYPPKPVGISKEPGGQFMPDEKNRAIYENITVEEPNNADAFDALPDFLRGEHTVARGRWKERYGTPLHYQESMKNYYALITQVDGECKKIINELKNQGLLNETMIIFTADNGMFHGSHGLAGKWYPYQESIRVPLIIYDPRMSKEKQGTVDDSYTLNIDLAKTILGAAGIEPPATMNGRDMSDLYLTDNRGRTTALEKEPWRTEFFYEFPYIFDHWIPESTALVRKAFKYINWPRNDNYEQLFDLRNDPLEVTDLRDNPEYQEVMSEMREVHDRLRDEVQKPNRTGKLPCPEP